MSETGEKWILEIRGPVPDGGRPSWVRRGRLPASASEAEVLSALSGLREHGPCRARRDGTEIVLGLTGSYTVRRPGT